MYLYEHRGNAILPTTLIFFGTVRINFYCVAMHVTTLSIPLILMMISAFLNVEFISEYLRITDLNRTASFLLY